MAGEVGVTGGPAVVAALRLPDADTAADLRTYLSRAYRADPDGAARLVGHGDVLAAYVSPVHGGGGPTILGLRTLRLGGPSLLDRTAPLAALVAALGPAGPAGPGALQLPDEQVHRAGWTGVSPPRRGWQPIGTVEGAVLAERAASGIAEVAQGSPSGSGAAAVAGLRAAVWGRPLADDLPDVPAGVSYAARALGFLDPGTPAAVYRSGPWWRVSTPAGHVLARRPALL